MAPEALKYVKFSSATDVWAYGVTIWEIYTLGQFPYSHVQNNDIRKQILNGLTLRIPDQVPDSIKNVISQCWIFLPEKRCSFDDIVTRIAESPIQQFLSTTRLLLIGMVILVVKFPREG